MNKYTLFQRSSYCFMRKFTTQKKPNVVPDESMLQDIENEAYKPRNHPGILKPRVVMLPDGFINAARNVTEEFPVKSLIEDSALLQRHLKGKRPPLEKDDLRKMSQDAHERVAMGIPFQKFESDEERARYRQKVKDKATKILKYEVYNWKPVHYDTHNSLVYMMARSAAEYAVLVKIFTEISVRDEKFSPRSLFDFGSGVGTVSWAANMFWKKNIFEYFNVDSSAEMNDLALLLLQGGRNKNMNPKGVYYRQFLPASNVGFDLVVSAYSLMELPSQHSRLETILNLWNKTQKYLVILEQGTKAGFQVVNEARDFILQNGHSVGHVFSPCPHDQVCPRFMRNDGTPCNFSIAYHNLPIGIVSQRHRELYSYVVLKKGERSPDDPQWPRVVRDTLVRSKHSICRLCTSKAELKEVIFTASKHGKTMYHCARSTKWGDLVPIKLEETIENNEIEEPET